MEHKNSLISIIYIVDEKFAPTGGTKAVDIAGSI
jgi:hypothetical protein